MAVVVYLVEKSSQMQHVFLLQSIFIKQGTNDLYRSCLATCTWTLLPLIKQAEPVYIKHLQSGHLQSGREPTATSVACGGRAKELLVDICADKDE